MLEISVNSGTRQSTSKNGERNRHIRCYILVYILDRFVTCFLRYCLVIRTYVVMIVRFEFLDIGYELLDNRHWLFCIQLY